MTAAGIIFAQARAAWSTSSSRCLNPSCFKRQPKRARSFAFNTEYLRHEQDLTGVTATLRDRLDGREYTLRARYMVGADGARSSVVEKSRLADRRANGARGYRLHDLQCRPFQIQQAPSQHPNRIVTPDASFGEIGLGLLRAVRPWTQWIAGWGFDINKGEPDLSEGPIREKIKVLIGDPLDRHRYRANLDLVRQSGLCDTVTPRYVFSAAAMQFTAILRRVASATTPACRTAITSVGNWRMRSRDGPGRNCWRAIRRSEPRSASRWCCGQTSPCSTTLP